MIRSGRANVFVAMRNIRAVAEPDGHQSYIKRDGSIPEPDGHQSYIKREAAVPEPDGHQSYIKRDAAVPEPDGHQSYIKRYQARETDVLKKQGYKRSQRRDEE